MNEIRLRKVAILALLFSLGFVIGVNVALSEEPLTQKQAIFCFMEGNRCIGVLYSRDGRITFEGDDYTVLKDLAQFQAVQSAARKK